MLLVTTALLVAVGKRSDGTRASVTAIASVTTFETGILVTLLEALGGASGWGHVIGGERVGVESTLTGVVGVAALVDVTFVLVVTAGGGGLGGSGGGYWGVDILGVNVDDSITAAGLGGVASTGLGALGDVDEVRVDKVIAAVLGVKI